MAVLAFLFGSPLTVIYATDRLPWDVKINGQPVRLAFDTGAQFSVLFRSAAKRLRLKITKVEYREPLAAGKVPYDIAEECTLETGMQLVKATFGVIDDPPYNMKSDVDGFIAWNSVSNSVFHLDAERIIYGFPDDVPSDLNGWSRWKLVPNSELLVFEAGNSMETVKIGIDTGSDQGVLLSRKRWQVWRAGLKQGRSTIEASWTPSGGFEVKEVLRATKITIGRFSLSDVPVTAANLPVERVFGDCDAILGLFAFRQLALIIDGKNGFLYTRPIAHPVGQYAYNRLGAVFVPKDADKSDDLVAHVIKDSPAYRAGVRDGDVLLEIGELDATKWRADPHVLPLSRFWNQVAGTKLNLTVKHKDQPSKFMITLEELPAAD